MFNLRQLKRAIAASPVDVELETTIQRVCRGEPWKSGLVVVVGGFSNPHAVNFIAGRGHSVIVYESEDFQTLSKVTGLPVHRRPILAPEVSVKFYDGEGESRPVGVLFLLRDVPRPCFSFTPAAKIVGDESLLRGELKGRQFSPVARWRDLTAMEIL